MSQILSFKLSNYVPNEGLIIGKTNNILLCGQSPNSPALPQASYSYERYQVLLQRTCLFLLLRSVDDDNIPGHI